MQSNIFGYSSGMRLCLHASLLRNDDIRNIIGKNPAHHSQVEQALLTAHKQGKKDRDEEIVKETQKAMADVVSVLHKEFCYTGLVTKNQWNESIAPKLKELQNIIRGLKKDSPTAQVYKFPKQ